MAAVERCRKMSASKLCLFGTGLLRSHKPLAALPPVLTKPFVPHPLQFRPLCSSIAVETLRTQTTESPLQPLVHHPWPEWVTFVNNLMKKGYLIGSPPACDSEDGDAKTNQFYNNMNLLKDPCVSFAHDRYDIFKSLSRQDIQAVVECGGPNLLQNAANSSKRLRMYLKLHEGDVCGSCDSAYVLQLLLQETEAKPRTVDVVRILLAYALDPLVIKGDQKLPGRELAEESARKLLAQLVELSETSSASALPKPAIKASSSKEKTSRSKERKNRSKERKNQSVVVEMKKGDWTCPKCNFLNFAKTNVCRKCKEDCPIQAVEEEVVLSKGDWICSDCQFMNFSKNTVCLRCQAQGPEKPEIEMKPGDWKCQECQLVNFSRNVQCLKCQAPGPEKRSLKIEMKPGDWNCEKCSYINFAKNVKCLSCEECRPKNPGQWHCLICDHLNYSGREMCQKCNNKLPTEEKTDLRRAAMEETCL